MDSAEIRRRFLAFFADRGHTVVPSASLLLDDRRCSSSMREWCHSSPTSWRGGPGIHPRHQCAEVRPDTRYRRQSARPPVTHRSSRCAEISRSATSKGNLRSPGLGTAHQLAGRRWFPDLKRTDCGQPSTRMTMRASSCGSRSPIFQQSAFSAAARRTISGPMGVPGPCGPCGGSTSIEARNTVRGRSGRR